MLPTIPFKRHEPGDEPVVNKSVAAKPQDKSTSVAQKQPKHTAERVSKKAVAPRKRLSLWVIVLIVVGVAIVGLVVLRFSRASGTEPQSIPLDQSDLQTFVSAQTAGQPNPTLDVSGYSQFQFGTKLQNASQVAYYIDQKLIETKAQKPYTFLLDTTRLPNGSHQLTAVAFDSVNNPVGATTRIIDVQNTTGVLQGVKNVVTYPWYALFNL